MAFKRTNFGALKSTKRETFETKYKFSKQLPNFKVGSDAYVIPIGLETGYYETPCHKVLQHKVNGQTIGFGGTGVNFPVYIKCLGIDEEGNTTSSLCCALAEKERGRFPETNDAGKRIISSRSSRVHLPILILGNSLKDPNKTSYPISKVSILNELKSEAGLKFSYLDMSSYTFKQDIVCAYGTKLKEEGLIDYEMDENSEEYYETVCLKLASSIIKIHGVAKQGFSATMREYSFFPLESPAIASGSGEEEKNAITNYKENPEIMAKVDEFLQLFNIEVDGLVRTWKEKDLQEYYNSAIGVDIKASVKKEEVKEEEVIEEVEEAEEEKQPISDEEMDEILENPFGDEEPVETEEATAEPEMDSIDYDMEEDESFFEE
jgi:hypothetical protein